MKTENIYELLEKEIIASDIPEGEKNKTLSKLVKARGQKINLLIVGATGSGKSSTVNSLFNTSVAKVGVGVDPQTSAIECYQLENLTVWDSPGLGDGTEKDKLYSHEIVNKLSETDKNGVPIIDLVLVVLDASSKDMGTALELINEVLLPCLTPENNGRILIAVNQSDMAMKGNHWDRENNCPDEVLKDFLNKKCASVRERLLQSTGFEFKVMYYCAGYTEDDGTQRPAYNLTKLLYQIVMALPAEKRMAIAENLNNDADMWMFDDKEQDYTEEIAEGFTEIFFDTLFEFSEAGGEFGRKIFGLPGSFAGSVIGGVAGAVIGVFKGIFKR